MLTDEEKIEARQLARRYGSANCWTGTTGSLALYLLAALREIEQQQDKLGQLQARLHAIEGGAHAT